MGRTEIGGMDVAPVRKTLAAAGRRTVFNFLGPLINPGRPAHVLLGVFSESWAVKLAATLENLGARAGLAAAGMIDAGRGIDELTTATTNRVRGFGRLAALDERWAPGAFGFRIAPFAELRGGDVAANAATVERDSRRTRGRPASSTRSCSMPRSPCGSSGASRGWRTASASPATCWWAGPSRKRSRRPASSSAYEPPLFRHGWGARPV